MQARSAAHELGHVRHVGRIATHHPRPSRLTARKLSVRLQEPAGEVIHVSRLQIVAVCEL